MATVEVAGVGFAGAPVVQVAGVRFGYGAAPGEPAPQVQVAGVRFSYGQAPTDPARVQVAAVRFAYGPVGGFTPGESLLAQWDGDRWVRLPVVTWDGTAWVGAS